ncbi:unnamed protein product [Enterobius vermicularis]|uniref:Protein-lysine N-methyltransferase EVEC_LOCUS12163 n=1 Tax=Enterobius vermicularis TaxID=51028 RepID=A0A0N4VPR7_ENTVE|nr:unnamed protein product [Enterobius vermicularis]
MYETGNTVNHNVVNEASTDDDDTPCLSQHTLSALAEFYAERKTSKDENNVEEDWQVFVTFQLSQFWYSKETAETLAAECITAVEAGGNIACVSCPTLMEGLVKSERIRSKKLLVKLLEYDLRFASVYPTQFIFYDYKSPLALPEGCCKMFDLIVIDPPFLSDECFIKMAQTVRLLSKSSATKIILCTGTIMRPMVERLFKAHQCSFSPSHRRNLANEFACFANYQTSIL